ncbi:MAG: hypothetical protein Q8P76_02395 [bacterium]|nr:hypothetical protein [bacterium]
MDEFQLFAQPWWVNLLVLVPFLAYYFWRKNSLEIPKFILVVSAVFGIAFGFVEAAVVVYLRGAVGLLTDYAGADIYQQAQILGELPKNLWVIEFFREVATIVMLVSIALLAVKSLRERWAIFLWVFAWWDIFYYAGLRATVRWPSSLLSPDVLFLIPVPWFSQVWFPILVSALTIGAVILTTKSGEKNP